MSTFLNLLLHAFLISSMAAFAYFLFRAITNTDRSSERLMRAFASFIGAFAVLTANAMGVGLADFLAGSLAAGRVASAGALAVTTVLPGLLGAGVGYYFKRVYSRNERDAMRLLCLLGAMGLLSFVQVYAAALQTEGVFLATASAANASFIVGVGIAILFVDMPAMDRRLSGLASRVKRLFKRHPDAAPQATPQAPAAGSTRDPLDIG